MTTNSANAAIKNFKALKLQYDAYLAEVEPIKNSFFSFLEANQHLDKWLQFRIAAEFEPLTVNDFYLDLDNSVEEGLLFYREAFDYDGSVSLSFVVPFAYINDPESWTAAALALAASDQKLVEAIYDSAAPNIRKELDMEVYIHGINDDEIFAWLVERGNDGITLNHPHREKMVMNSFIVSRETGEVISKTLV